MTVIRVLIADDHPVVRRGLCSMLANVDDIEVVGEASSAAETLEQIKSLRPDVVLLDIRMPPHASGFRAAQQATQRYPTTRIIFLTTYEEDQLILRAFEVGAHGYLLKNISAEQLATAIRLVFAGEWLLSEELMSRTLHQLGDLARKRAKSHADISDSELQILKLVAQGATNKEIAQQLHWSEMTIKRKLSDIFVKLEASDRAQAVAEAMRRGLI
jgi:DNA-binding NarL/FixJ family response regulator